MKRMVMVVLLMVLTASAGMAEGGKPEVKAELKLGWVDLEKVFRGYYKTKATLAGLEADVNKKEGDLKELMEEIKKLQADLESSREVLSEGGKEKQEKLIEEKKLKASQLKKEGELELGREIMVEKGKLLEEIIEAVEKVGKAEGYTFIFRGELPELVLYKEPVLDITEKVLAEINQGQKVEEK